MRGEPWLTPVLASDWNRHLLVVGFPAGIAKLPLNPSLPKSCDVHGVFWGAFAAGDPAANAANVEALFRLWDEGKISLKVSRTLPLEQGAEAIAAHGGPTGDREPRGHDRLNRLSVRHRCAGHDRRLSGADSSKGSP